MYFFFLFKTNLETRRASEESHVPTGKIIMSYRTVIELSNYKWTMSPKVEHNDWFNWVGMLSDFDV